MGNPGNPGGKTSEQRKAEIANAERATRLRGRMLAALEKSLDAAFANGDEADKAAIEAIGSDTLRLIKDSEDRGFGTPTMPIDHKSSDGSMSTVTDEHLTSRIAAIQAKLGQTST